MRKETPTRQFIEECLNYDPETGEFRWKDSRPSNHFKTQRGYSIYHVQHAGKKAGSTDTHGYVQIEIKGMAMLAHRIAWLISHREWPVDMIDHINGNRSDNRLINLREATKPQNMQNAKVRRDSKTGVKGVSWRESTQSWHASIKCNGKNHFLGVFQSLEEASMAVGSARSKLHGAFARQS